MFPQTAPPSTNVQAVCHWHNRMNHRTIINVQAVISHSHMCSHVRFIVFISATDKSVGSCVGVMSLLLL